MNRVLIVLTSASTLGSTGRPTGWYLPEVTHVYWPLVDAGFEVEFASPKGGAAPMDPGSRKLEDPYNKRFVEDAKAMAAVARTLRPEEVDATRYAAIFFAGGHGTMWDFRNEGALAKLTAAIFEQGGVVSAVCHGPAALVDVKLSSGAWLVDGQDLVSFTDAEESAVGLTGIVPFLLESSLKERGARFHGGANWSNTVVVGDRLITGQNPQSALTLAKRLVEVLRAQA